MGDEERQDRHADDHSDRVRADQVAGRRRPDADADGDLRQHAHGDELGRTDREPAHRQGEHGDHETG
ncbi:hypothetical protein [Nocardioides luteus]|uniref:hypothetical protein n=1 Tax=Nocardioides luteus TaxID=1844 RepID=UPI0022F2D290|nr:hypothetical protein [Nocardioides luteus]